MSTVFLIYLYIFMNIFYVKSIVFFFIIAVNKKRRQADNDKRRGKWVEVPLQIGI